MIYTDTYDSPLGELVMTAENNKLLALTFRGQRYFETNVPTEQSGENISVFEDTKRWLDIYFAGKIPDFTPEIELRGTEFRMAVWKHLLEIPYGEAVTYGDIAKKIASERGLAKMSAQAVGGAVGHNPVAIIVPCHRVVGEGGNLTGYGGGIHRKVELLKIEKAYKDSYYIPKKGTAL